MSSAEHEVGEEPGTCTAASPERERNTMPSSLLSPFLELDADLPQDFVTLFSGVSLQIAAEEQSNTYSSCPVNLNDNAKSNELFDSTLWPDPSVWSLGHDQIPVLPLRRVPFQADRSVSMIEESQRSQELLKPGSCRYKTELCRTYRENRTCKYGTKCQFAHGQEELRGLNRHPKYKTELCRTYHTVGFCPYGSRCHFIHNIEEQRFKIYNGGLRPVLKQSLSCSGIPSFASSLSSSLSSSSLTSSLTSLSSFSPSSPITSASNPFYSVGPPSPTSPPPVVLNLPSFEPVSPTQPKLQDLMSGGMQQSPWKIEAPEGESLDSSPQPKEAESILEDSPEGKRLPIFSLLSD